MMFGKCEIFAKFDRYGLVIVAYLVFLAVAKEEKAPSAALESQLQLRRLRQA